MKSSSRQLIHHRPWTRSQNLFSGRADDGDCEGRRKEEKGRGEAADVRLSLRRNFFRCERGRGEREKKGRRKRKGKKKEVETERGGEEEARSPPLPHTCTRAQKEEGRCGKKIFPLPIRSARTRARAGERER